MIFKKSNQRGKEGEKTIIKPERTLDLIKNGPLRLKLSLFNKKCLERLGEY